MGKPEVSLMEANEVIREVETIKLIKNTKGYNWEIKIIKSMDTDEKWVLRMKKLNDDLENRYGSELKLD